MISSRLPTPALKARLKSGPSIGCHWLSLGSPAIAELAADAGPDAIVIDTQHGLWDRSTMESAIGAVAGRAPVLVRVADQSDWAIGSALDAGAHGVIVPMVNTADECARVIGAVQYPPVGRRSGGGARTSADFAAYRGAAQHLVASVMIETAEAVEAAEAIAATPGLDLIFIGPGDLTLSLGAGQGTPAFEAAVAKVMAAGKAAGVPVGIFTTGIDQALARAREGHALVVAAYDVAVTRSATAQVRRFQQEAS
ncbi:HpcH/HpaI aldolase family protein [Caulobacter sp. KR2-114]|uniref:HpcH/HpaI aldolase family protein n=1 Tax=Caulobacter sp. KR2-114 TaxID=3400912 RepID=UPI003C10A31B